MWMKVERAEPLRARNGKKRKRKGKRKCHGRNGAKDYTGAKRETVSHGEVKAGGPYPEPLCQGKLYDTQAPRKDVELKAQPPIQATVYERQMLRCAGCQKTFTAPLPPQAGASKYHPSVDAVVSVLRYAMGMPHHRLAQWQKWAGASTQFERAEAMANAVLPVFRHMETLAANRPLVHSDDTGVRILTLMAENETLAQGERTGIFTTGIVARGLDKTLAPIVLYASGRRHAGENMDQLLNQRTVQASKVIHMADASSMAPRSPLRITAKCMVHVAGRLARDGETQLKQSPENPGRFSLRFRENQAGDARRGDRGPVLESPPDFARRGYTLGLSGSRSRGTWISVGV